MDGRYVAVVRALAVPPDTKADLHDLVRQWTALQAIHLQAAHVSSWTEFDDMSAATKKAGQKASAAANLLRSDLGLPPVQY